MEWRVVYTHELNTSTRLVRDVKVIDGTPQPIFKIPLKNVPEVGLTGVTLPELLERIIIGPTQNTQVIRDAFVELLTQSGVPDAGKKVFLSEIPLRLLARAASSLLKYLPAVAMRSTRAIEMILCTDQRDRLALTKGRPA
jgi:hypothetical protein